MKSLSSLWILDLELYKTLATLSKRGSIKMFTHRGERKPKYLKMNRGKARIDSKNIEDKSLNGLALNGLKNGKKL